MNDKHTITASEGTQKAQKASYLSAIRWHAFLVGLAIIPADNYWVIMMEKVRPGPYPTIISIFANVVFILAILAILNTLLRRINPRIAFSTAEMLLIYTMAAIGASLAGHDMIPNLITTITYPWRYATPENGWANNMIPHLPQWLCVSDKAALTGLYEGHSSLYAHGYWRLWLMPMLYWMAFIVVLVFVMMCINTLVRKQWTDRERLTFPIVHLPFSMTEPKGELWKNKLFWLGFAIAFGIDFNNGLATWVPALPQIVVSAVDAGVNFTSKPWNALGWTPYAFYPFVIGLGFLLPADLLFSCWFFYIFWKLQMVAVSAMAWDSIPDFPYIRQQAFGGYVAILIMLLWSSRGYLKQMWLRLRNLESELDDSDEPMSYRSAVAGALIGLAFLSAFMWHMGMSPLVAVIAFIIYFILSTAIARMRAELGPPVHDLHFTGPDFIITNAVGLNNLGTNNMVGLSFLYWFNRAHRGHPMPIGLEGMKMAQNTRSSQKKFFWAVMLATVMGVVASFWAYLFLGYKLGLSAKFRMMGFGGDAINNLSNWMSSPPQLMEPNWGANMASAIGFVFCAFLSYMRMKIFNWPFHPIGYAISGSWSMNLVWLPLMIAWALKVITLKFGGMKGYKAAIPFFLGLILGEMIMGSIWSLVGIIFDIPTYSFWGA